MMTRPRGLSAKTYDQIQQFLHASGDQEAIALAGRLRDETGGWAWLNRQDNEHLDTQPLQAQPFVSAEEIALDALDLDFDL